ncbi:MAG: hypothetical protein KC503_08055 [Myxococcales bacterium]|nr:hypothetical protein [Myxococcales bacterium]
MKRILVVTSSLALLLAIAGHANAQYAVGHRSFGGGTSLGGGFTRLEYNFPDVKNNRGYLLLPTIELKFFLSDTLSLDFSVPVVNIAASNALQDYFFVTGEAYINFHPSAPSSFELFVAPGIGFSYAQWSDGNENAGARLEDRSGYAFHIPVRIGFEINFGNRRNFSMFVAARPFFSLVHGGTNTKAGGGFFAEIGIMGYAVKYRADRY